MEVRYGDRELERLCTDENIMRRKRGDIAAGLRRRINALNEAHSVGELRALDPLGKWHPLTGNRAGSWAGKLDRHNRIVIETDGAGASAITVTVVEIVDYHSK